MKSRVLAGVAVTAMLMVGVVGVGGSAHATGANQTQVIKTLDLPTWDDVQEAKRNKTAAAEKVAEIEALLVQVQANVEAARAKSNDAMQKAMVAEEQFQSASRRADELMQHAEASEKEAHEAANQAAALISQMYRSGGVDRNLEMFLQTDASTADALLDKLAMMEKATERNTQISEEAQYAMNNARSLGEQATSAQNERERLYSIAEDESAQASIALEAARQELVQAEQQEVELSAQLAALKDEETKTVEGYQERLRIEEEERKERERLAAEAARKAAEEAAKLQQQQQNNGGGGGGGGSAPVIQASGWVRPLPGGSYWVSTEWWGYWGHTAMDLAAGLWTPVYAASSGTVTHAGWVNDLCGNGLYMVHAYNTGTRYCHMVQTPNFWAGQWVNAGDIIGYVGSTGASTGPHLHFETLSGGVLVNPRPFMNERGIWL